MTTNCIMGCGTLLTGGEEHDVCFNCCEMMDWENLESDGDPVEEKKSKTKTYKPLPKCTHEGMPYVFTIGKGKVFASGERDSNNWDLSRVDLIVSLNGHYSPTFKINEGAKDIIPESLSGLYTSLSFPRLSMHWTDGGAPPFDKSYVTLLVELVSLGTNIMIHCMGGHGRTGTLLMALIYTAGLDSKHKDPLKWLRKAYCNKAVESNTQMEWLKDTYGMKTKEKSVFAAQATSITTTTKGNFGLRLGKKSK